MPDIGTGNNHFFLIRVKSDFIDGSAWHQTNLISPSIGFSAQKFDFI